MLAAGCWSVAVAVAAFDVVAIVYGVNLATANEATTNTNRPLL